MKRRFAKWAVIPALFFALAACSGDSDDSTSNAKPVDESYVDVTDQQGSVEDFVGANEDATTNSCEATKSTWVSEGTVTNPEKDAQSYRLYVAFNRGKDTQGLVQVDVKSVEPGKTAEWTAEAPLKGEGLKCVLRVERFAPQD